MNFLLKNPHSPGAEAVRTLYTSVMYSKPGSAPRTILVVSGSPAEGKTTVAVNLAVVLAQHSKVCLLEADLRRPTVARLLGVPNTLGVTNVLTGHATVEDALREVSGVPNLRGALAGPVAPNPTELLGSKEMEKLLQDLKERFDHVVIDSPPIIPFADARSLCMLSEGVIVVCRAAHTPIQMLMRVTEILDGIHAQTLGVVINGVDLASPDYNYYHYGRYYSYGYLGYSYKYKYGYYQGEGDGSERKPKDGDEEGL